MSQQRPASHHQAAEPTQVIALRWQARALAPMVPPHASSSSQAAASSSSSHYWLVGTAAAREQNELDVVEYDPASRELRCAASWAHPAEVWAVAAHPSGASAASAAASSADGGAGGGGAGHLLVATAWQAAPTPQHCRAAGGGGGGGGGMSGDDAARAARPGWGATVWRAPSLGDGGSRTAALSRACDLERRRADGGGSSGGSGSSTEQQQQQQQSLVPVRAVAWSPHQSDEVLTADADGTLRAWRVGNGGAARVQASCGGGGGGSGGGAGDARRGSQQQQQQQQQLWGAEPHPRQPGLIAAATDAGVLVYDMRAGALVGSFGCGAGSGSSSGACPSCGLARWRSASARCVGWPPSDEGQGGGGGFCLTSAGDDARLRFWDLRALSSSPSSPSAGTPRCTPLQTLGGGHGHAITHIAHHPQRGALVATAGADGRAALWHTPRAAAAAAASGASGIGGAAGLGAVGAGVIGEEQGEEDGRVWSWDDPTAGGDDALRGVAWAQGGGGGGGGQRDAWSLAALAHDGRVAVHHVPRAVRYAVLV